jgi:DNA-binding protein HU-beta
MQVNKAELTAAIAGHTAVEPKTVATVLAGLEDVVAANVKKGEKVIITGFVGFERTDRRARKGRNPATGAPIRIKASKGVRVSPGASLRKVVNGDAPVAKLGKAAPVIKAARKTAAPAPAKRSAAAGTTRTRVTAASKKAPAAPAKKAPGRPAKAATRAPKAVAKRAPRAAKR